MSVNFETSIDEIMNLISEQTACIYLDLYPEDNDEDDKISDNLMKEIEIKLTEKLLKKLNSKVKQLKKE